MAIDDICRHRNCGWKLHCRFLLFDSLSTTNSCTFNRNHGRIMNRNYDEVRNREKVKSTGALSKQFSCQLICYILLGFRRVDGVRITWKINLVLFTIFTRFQFTALIDRNVRQSWIMGNILGHVFYIESTCHFHLASRQNSVMNINWKFLDCMETVWFNGG